LGAGRAGSEHVARDDGNEFAAEGGGRGGAELRAALPAHGGLGTGASFNKYNALKMPNDEIRMTKECPNARITNRLDSVKAVLCDYFVIMV
jgi:uncharacterized spore protein YtfJ